MNAFIWKRSMLLALPAMAVAVGIALSQPGPEDFEVVRQRQDRQAEAKK